MNAGSRWWFVSGTVMLAAAIAVLLAVGLSQARGLAPERETQAGTHAVAAALVPDRIPVQGRLADADGSPLDGTFDLTFRLYDVAEGGAALCSDTKAVEVDAGLFSSFVEGCAAELLGQELYLGVEVGSDGEMAPRQPIYPLPYAMSLRPGAVISDSRSYVALNQYTFEDPDTYAVAVRAVATGADHTYGVYATADDYGVFGFSDNIGVRGQSPAGTGMRGATYSGTGVHGQSEIGIGVLGTSYHGHAAIAARGEGIISSTASSYLWISGNGLRPYHQGDSTIIDLDSSGGAVVQRGAAAGSKNVMLPIAIQGPLYGQDVTVSRLEIYWKGETTSEQVSGIILRRQTGVGSYANIVFETGASYTCSSTSNPNGCTVPHNLSNNNVLTEDSGILYLTLELSFSASDTWIQIGGIRLTLEHD